MNDAQPVRLLSRGKSLLTAALSSLSGRGGAEEVEPWVAAPNLIIRPANGHASLLSYRRQLRKRWTKAMPKYRSGRQWTKFRKALRREQGVEYLSLPTYMVKKT